MKKAVLLTIVNILASPTVLAIDLGHDFTLKGFGTFGMVHSPTNEADFVSNHYFEAEGAGRYEENSLKVDSKFGAQLSWQATERLSFTGQAVTKQANQSWEPHLEWAFAKFKVLPDLDLRAGRIRPAIYLLSDYLDVNYANPWIRPPIEFYSPLPLSRMEGGDLLWRPKTGSVSWLIQPYYGESHLHMPESRIAEISDIWGINVSASVDDFTFRLGFVQLSLTIDSPRTAEITQTFNRLCLVDAIACMQKNTLLVKDKRVSFGSLGVTWDNGDYFLSGELGKRDTETVILDSTSWYVSAGTRIREFTPYATYSSYKNDSPLQFNGSSLAATNQLSTSLILNNNPMNQTSFTLGIRYDFIEDMALKVQWDRIDTDATKGINGTGGGLFNHATTDFKNRSNSIDMFSVSVDFSF